MNKAVKNGIAIAILSSMFLGLFATMYANAGAVIELRQKVFTLEKQYVQIMGELKELRDGQKNIMTILIERPR